MINETNVQHITYGNAAFVPLKFTFQNIKYVSHTNKVATSKIYDYLSFKNESKHLITYYAVLHNESFCAYVY